MMPSSTAVVCLFSLVWCASAIAAQQHADFGRYAANVDVATRVCSEHVQVDVAKLEKFKERWTALAKSPDGEEALESYGMTIQLLKTYFRVNRKAKFKEGCENTAKAVIFGLGKDSPVMIDNLPPELQEKLK